MPLKTGIQLYSVRESFAEDSLKTLKAIADTGCRYVEAANHNAAEDDGVGFGLPARQLRTRLEDLGLQIVGCHVNPLRPDRLPAILDYHCELGNPQIGCDTEFFPPEDMEFLLRRCELYNEVGLLCRERGMRYYCHNHYMEFQRIGGRLIYDLVMEHTDPDLVFLELDTYWAARAGVDPAALIRKYADRLILLHQKDFPADAPQPMNMYAGVIAPDAAIDMDLFLAKKDPGCFTEIGTGILPIQSYIDAAAEAPGLEYILLEQDFSKLPELESVRVSMAHFRKMKGISF